MSIFQIIPGEELPSPKLTDDGDGEFLLEFTRGIQAVAAVAAAVFVFEQPHWEERPVFPGIKQAENNEYVEVPNTEADKVFEFSVEFVDPSVEIPTIRVDNDHPQFEEVVVPDLLLYYEQPADDEIRFVQPPTLGDDDSELIDSIVDAVVALYEQAPDDELPFILEDDYEVPQDIIPESVSVFEQPDEDELPFILDEDVEIPDLVIEVAPFVFDEIVDNDTPSQPTSAISDDNPETPDTVQELEVFEDPRAIEDEYHFIQPAIEDLYELIDTKVDPQMVLESVYDTPVISRPPSIDDTDYKELEFVPLKVVHEEIYDHAERPTFGGIVDDVYAEFFMAFMEQSIVPLALGFTFEVSDDVIEGGGSPTVSLGIRIKRNGVWVLIGSP